MDMRFNKEGDKLTVYLSGEMDEFSSGGIKKDVDELIESERGISKVIFDLSSLTFMDSTGVGFLIGRYKRARRLNLEIGVVNPTPAADKILSMSGVYSLMQKA